MDLPRRRLLARALMALITALIPGAGAIAEQDVAAAAGFFVTPRAPERRVRARAGAARNRRYVQAF